MPNRTVSALARALVVRYGVTEARQRIAAHHDRLTARWTKAVGDRKRHFDGRLFVARQVMYRILTSGWRWVTPETAGVLGTSTTEWM